MRRSRQEETESALTLLFFFFGGEGWREIRPDLPVILRPIASRVGKEVAHLTYARQDVDPEAKGWRVIDMAVCLTSLSELFLEKLPNKMLGLRWANWTAGEEDLRGVEQIAKKSGTWPGGPTVDDWLDIIRK